LLLNIIWVAWLKDKKSPFMGGGIAYAGGGRAMKRKGGKA
jgi:hypothetical protein